MGIFDDFINADLVQEELARHDDMEIALGHCDGDIESAREIVKHWGYTTSYEMDEFDKIVENEGSDLSSSFDDF